MSLYLDSYLLCPLNESHQILKSRMQYHLVRCMKQHPLKSKLQCPWNTLHIVDRLNYLEHIETTCEDLVNVWGPQLVEITNSLDEKGNYDVASIPIDTSIPAYEGESWDCDVCVGTYDPIKNTEDKAVYRSCIGLSKAQRKAFRERERERHRQLENQLPIQIKSPAKKNMEKKEQVDPRPPRKTQIAQVKNTVDESPVTKWPTKLRTPNAPAPALYATSDDYSDSDASTNAVNSDSKSYRSGKSARNPNLTAFVKPSSNKSYATAASSRANEEKKIELPSTSTITVDELALELAKLESIEKNISEKKAALRQQMMEKQKKTNEAQVDTEPEKLETVDNAMPLKNDETKILKTENGLTKSRRTCAANFNKTPQQENRPVIGFGRGLVIDHSNYRKPGGNSSEVLQFSKNDSYKENIVPSPICSKNEKNQPTLSYSQVACNTK